jgi:Tol biopolymer transport system component
VLLGVLGLAALAFGPAWYQRAFAPPRDPLGGDEADALLKGAVLVLTFDKEDFYEKDGKTYVRDRSGSGHDGLCDGVTATAEGKAGGGLQCRGKGALRLPVSLFNHRADYTITAWVHLVDDGRNQDELGWLFVESPPERDQDLVFGLPLPKQGSLHVNAWNQGREKEGEDYWLNANTRPGVFPYREREWVFLAFALENGACGSGLLRVCVDDRHFGLTSQMVDFPVETSARLGLALSGALDEVAVFHRALSAQELEALRQRGIEGKPLAKPAVLPAVPRAAASRDGAEGEPAARQGEARPRPVSGEVWQVAISPDGKTLAVALGRSGVNRPGELKLWDLATGQVRSLFRAPEAVRCVAFSPDGRTVAAGGFDNLIRLFDRATGKRKHVLRGHTGGVNGVAFSPDGKLVGSCGLDRTVRLWDAVGGQELANFTAHQDRVLSLAFSPDGRSLATGSQDKSAKIWDLASREVRHTLRGHDQQVEFVTFSPDSKTVATASWDGTVRLWDAAQGKTVSTLRGHTGGVNGVAFSPDGLTVATASWDHTIRLWNAASGGQLAILEGHWGIVWSLAFFPDGKTLASGSWDKMVRLWDVATRQERRILGG